jgi:hypothetical protein
MAFSVTLHLLDNDGYEIGMIEMITHCDEIDDIAAEAINFLEQEIEIELFDVYYIFISSIAGRKLILY